MGDHAVPSPYRYTTPAAPKAATGETAAVYRQLDLDLGVRRAPAFTVLSAAPALLVASWVAVRESLLAGGAPRDAKALVAAGVVRATPGAVRVAGHLPAPHVAGGRRFAEALGTGGTPEDTTHARLLAWGAATRTPGAPELADPPFPPGHAPEYLGTALAAHFVGRIAAVLLTERAPAGPRRLRSAVRAFGGRPGTAAERRPPRPGESLALLGSGCGPEPSWADGAPVGAGFAALRRAATADSPALTDAVRTTVLAAVTDWDGGRPPSARSWLYGSLSALRGADRPAAALALLGALAPDQVRGTDVEFWRSTAPDRTAGDADLVRLIAFGAYAAAARVEASLAPATLRRSGAPAGLPRP
ncbi:DNA-binding protein [Streptomyces celluloflavus]|uniref:DNA-binding protein n=1 Tax=Streptomyces celluloflavus TaxID=58344 RepID=UPI0036B2802B